MISSISNESTGSAGIAGRVPGMAHLLKFWWKTGTTNPPLPDGRITPTDARALLETECLEEA